MIPERLLPCAARASRNVQPIRGPPVVRMLLRRAQGYEVLGSPTFREYSCCIRRLSCKPARERRFAVPRGPVAKQVALPAEGVEFPQQPRVRARSASLPRPPALPPPPKSGNLLDVLPYLVRLAVADRQLWWRLGIAVLLMLASKAAGEWGRTTLSSSPRKCVYVARGVFTTSECIFRKRSLYHE